MLDAFIIDQLKKDQDEADSNYSELIPLEISIDERTGDSEQPQEQNAQMFIIQL